MARRSTPSQPPADIKLNPEQMRQGADRIRRRIAELEQFQPTSVKERWAPETTALEAAIDEALSKVFGEGTPAKQRYSAAANLDSGPLIMGSGPDPIYKVHEWLAEGKTRALLLLRQAVKGLEEDLADAAPAPTPSTAADQSPLTDEVFIVHGRDDAAKEIVRRVIHAAGLKPVILHEQTNGGRTIIEKFEKHGSAVGFAVVVATPDDVGGLAVQPPDQPDLKPRARQNVIGEMFWFAGRLGREKVCALVKGDLEMPSDFAGVVYTPMDDFGGWKSKLLHELEGAGYTDLNWQAALR